MPTIDERPEATFIPAFLAFEAVLSLFEALCSLVAWDERIKARKTACFGQTYDDSGIDYNVVPMHPLLEPLCNAIERELGFRPTNCLANYYESGRSTMRFHSDATHNLAERTGIAIVSLGAERELIFRKKANHSLMVRYPLPHGSLLYMTQLTQVHWAHALKKTDTDDARISLTFRHILSPEQMVTRGVARTA